VQAPCKTIFEAKNGANMAGAAVARVREKHSWLNAINVSIGRA
jgi:hypothetical protein